jgi:hypothetical protein
VKQSRVQEVRFLPWAHESHALALSVLGGRLDGRTLELTDPRVQILDLSSPWQRARIELELRVPTRVLGRVLPEHEHADPRVEILISLRCDRTHLRRQVCLRRWSEGESGRFAAALTIARDELAEQATLDAYLVRSQACSSPMPGVASRLGARLASARPWVLQIDEAPARAGSYLETQYRSFARDPSIPPSNRAALYRLELEREDPILYLNADHERVRAVLDAKGTTGRRARLRELVFERIVSGVWTQLVLRAAARAVEDGELAYAWEHAVLDQWLPRLYPEQADDEARRRCLHRDYQRLPTLLVELDGALQTSGELAEIATKLADEL